jgi:hypothetical protein
MFLMKTKICVAVLAVAALLIPGKVAAKAEISMVTAAGPDWYGEIEITDPETLIKLDLGVFLDLENPVLLSSGLGKGYLITRGYLDGDAFIPFDRLMFFPGTPGYAYYLEIVNGSGPMDGNWYQATEAGQTALLGALEAAGVSLSARPISASSPPTGAAGSSGAPGFVAAGLTALVGGVVGWLAARMRSRKPEAVFAE